MRTALWFSGTAAAGLLLSWLLLLDMVPHGAQPGAQWLLAGTYLTLGGLGITAAWQHRRGPWPWWAALAGFALFLPAGVEAFVRSTPGDECYRTGFLPAGLYGALEPLTHGIVTWLGPGALALAGVVALRRPHDRPAAGWLLAGAPALWLVLSSHPLANGCWGA